ncbi:S26 family signal peptidase [Bifidobacterium sp. MA2]|uniref:S26 family signal peptidase n=1 Tax=Bifidobacterium santillanense TaxID=2809028 RepID=A0ABS5UQG3_9BIFI|nr:S26 family signal peptidase [Bifidobacterium santillanense]MBT1173142.1 S26 family signal peptidase [Bifidobacterium santillanense]
MTDAFGRDPESTSVAGGDIERVLREEGLFVSTTVGISMWPMLRNRRDTIVIRPLPGGERLSVGDVPLYRADIAGHRRYVLHRVVGVHDGWYAIRGDNCITTEHVRDAQVLGRLDEFYRGSRHVTCGSSRVYRLYWRTWLALWPARWCWKHARALVGRFLRRFGWKGLHPGRGPF